MVMLACEYRQISSCCLGPLKNIGDAKAKEMLISSLQLEKIKVEKEDIFYNLPHKQTRKSSGFP